MQYSRRQTYRNCRHEIHKSTNLKTHFSHNMDHMHSTFFFFFGLRRLGQKKPRQSTTRKGEYIILRYRKTINYSLKFQSWQVSHVKVYLFSHTIVFQQTQLLSCSCPLWILMITETFMKDISSWTVLTCISILPKQITFSFSLLKQCWHKSNFWDKKFHWKNLMVHLINELPYPLPRRNGGKVLHL